MLLFFSYFVFPCTCCETRLASKCWERVFDQWFRLSIGWKICKSYANARDNLPLSRSTFITGQLLSTHDWLWLTINKPLTKKSLLVLKCRSKKYSKSGKRPNLCLTRFKTPRETVPLQASLRIRKPGKICWGSYPANEECQKRGGKVFNFQKRKSCKNDANILIFNPAESVPGISFRRMHSHSRALYFKGTVYALSISREISKFVIFFTVYLGCR